MSKSEYVKKEEVTSTGDLTKKQLQFLINRKVIFLYVISLSSWIVYMWTEVNMVHCQELI